MEIIFISNFEEINVFSLVFVLCSFIPLFIAKSLVKKMDVFQNFPSKSMIFALILDSMMGQKIRKISFILSIFLYTVRYPKSFPVIRIESENVYSFIYIVASFSVNIYGLIYGLNNGSTALVSSSVLSIYNACSLVVVLFGDLVSHSPPNKQYSYGLHGIKHVFKFTSSLIILSSAYNLLMETSSGCLLPAIFVKSPWPVVFISTADFIMTLIGATTIGNFSITSYSLLCDIFISSSALISALFDTIFDLPQFDTIVSFVVCLILFVTLVNEIRGALNHLSLFSSKRAKNVILGKVGLDQNTECHIWNTGSAVNVVTLNCYVPKEKREQVRRATNEFFGDRMFDPTIEIK